jgi:hypothetical protein
VRKPIWQIVAIIAMLLSAAQVVTAKELKTWKDTTDPSCPMAIDKLVVKINSKYSTDYGEDRAWVEWTPTVRNKTDREVIQFKLDVKFFNATAEYIDSRSMDDKIEKVGSILIKPSATYGVTWADSYLGDHGVTKAVRAEASITYVKFSDGTIWTPVPTTTSSGQATDAAKSQSLSSGTTESFMAQIADLEKKLQAMQDLITALQSRIEKLESQVKALQGNQ